MDFNQELGDISVRTCLELLAQFESTQQVFNDMVWWIKECVDNPDEVEIDEPIYIYNFVKRHYDGGLRAFLETYQNEALTAALNQLED